MSVPHYFRTPPLTSQYTLNGTVCRRPAGRYPPRSSLTPPEVWPAVSSLTFSPSSSITPLSGDQIREIGLVHGLGCGAITPVKSHADAARRTNADSADLVPLAVGNATLSEGLRRRQGL